MAVYAIAQGRIEDREQFNQYLEYSGPTIEAHNAKLLAVDEAPVEIEGAIDYPRTVILEFESEDHFYRWYDSPEYQAARKQREDASVGRFILVRGL